MRVEIDLPNKDGHLRDGMYGQAVIQLEPPSDNLAIPASAVIDQNTKGEGTVYVVVNDKVETEEGPSRQGQRPGGRGPERAVD